MVAIPADPFKDNLVPSLFRDQELLAPAETGGMWKQIQA